MITINYNQRKENVEESLGLKVLEAFTAFTPTLKSKGLSAYTPHCNHDGKKISYKANLRRKLDFKNARLETITIKPFDTNYRIEVKIEQDFSRITKVSDNNQGLDSKKGQLNLDEIIRAIHHYLPESD